MLLPHPALHRLVSSGRVAALRIVQTTDLGRLLLLQLSFILANSLSRSRSFKLIFECPPILPTFRVAILEGISFSFPEGGFIELGHIRAGQLTFRLGLAYFYHLQVRILVISF